MADAIEFAYLEIPARIADLACRMAVPRDWNVVELPPEEVDFSEPLAFFPLTMVAAPWGAVVLTVAARPAFEDGTLQDWMLYLLSSQEIQPKAFGPVAIGELQGLGGVGRQEQEGTALEFRFAFFEDGGRLVQLGLFAPELISASLEEVWQRAVSSFVLERPRGQSAPLGAGMGLSPERGPEPVAAAEPEVEAAAEPEPEPARFTEEDFGYYAKADDAGTLDPEHPTNARLRDQGVGFAPNVLETDEEARTATIGAGAIGAVIRVAFGWFVIDDGKRTMVLDPDGKVQISLNVMATQGRSVNGILDDIQAEAEESHPEPQFLRLQDGGIWGLLVRGIAVNGEPVEQLHMLAQWREEAGMLRARVTADPGSMRYAANYADLILKSAAYGAAEREEPVEGPAWWREAVRLERADRLEEAERLVKESIPSLHFAIQTAEMYRLRWLRLRETDAERAREARQRAADWARQYASYATSGGEGAALSMERDEFLRSLGPEPL